MDAEPISTPANTQPESDNLSDSVEDASGLEKAIGKLSIPRNPSTEVDIDNKVPPPEYEYETSLPYSYSVEHSPTNLSQSSLETDLKTFKHGLTGSIPGLAVRLSVDSFAKRTASDMAAVRAEFRKRNNNGTFIPAFDEMLDKWDVSPAFKLAYRGLVLGPLLFDLWILQHVLCSEVSTNCRILMAEKIS
jgi:hypothetical protein